MRKYNIKIKYFFIKNLIKYLKKDSLALALVQAGIILANIFTIAVLARLFSLESFGTYNYLISVVSILSIFSLNGISTVLHRLTLKNIEDAFWGMIFLSLSFSVLVAIIAFMFHDYIFELFDIEEINRELSIYLLISILISSFYNYEGYLIGKNKYNITRLFNLLYSILNLLVSSIIAYSTLNVIYVFKGFIINRIIFLIIPYIYIIWKFKPIFNIKGLSNNINEIFIYSAGSGFINIISRLDNIIIGSYDLKLLAIYVASKEIPLQIKVNIKILLMSTANSWGILDKIDNLKKIRGAIKILIIFGAFLSIFSSAVITFSFNLIYGANFSGEIGPSILISISLIPVFLIYFVTMENQLQNKGNFSIGLVISRYLLFLPLLHYSLDGGIYLVAFSYVVSELFVGVIAYLYVKKNID